MRLTWMCVTALAMLLPGSASAARLLDDSARLVPAAVPTTTLTEATLATDVVSAEAPAGIGFGEHFGKTLGVGVFASTAGVLLAVPLGMLSNALAGQIPALLVQLLVGPALTVLGAWLVGNADDSGRYGYWGAFGVTFLVHLATFAVTSLALSIAVPWSNPVALLLYTLVDGLLMSGTSVGFMHLFPNKPKPTATVQSFVPGVTDTVVVPMSTVNF